MKMKLKKQIKPLRLLFLLFLFPLCAVAQTQTITVKGTVKDVNGGTLIGVNVIEEGTTNGTITDIDGNYKIKLSEKSKLSFSYIGYTTLLVDVEGKNTINIVLEEENKDLQEIVVVGYGNQRKEAVTGSVASVKGDILRDVPSANVSQALQGRVAGVQLAQTSTKPGATMQIRIRGTRSITADNNPLIVLDGIPFAGTIADISPDDIKSLDILKDASATAIYGSRGANGVILITTNKGIKEQKPQFTYSGYYGVKDALQYPMMNATEYNALRTYASKNKPGLDEINTLNAGTPLSTFSDGTQVGYLNGTAYDSYAYAYNTDWQGLFYKTGITSSHDFGVSGGNAKGNYKFGVGYYNDQAVIPGSDYTRYSIRASLDQEINKYFRVGFTTNNNFNVTNGAGLGMGGVLSMSPVADPYSRDADGNILSWKRTVKMPQDEQWVYSKDVIGSLGDKWQDVTSAFGSYNSMYGEVYIPGVEGLKYRINVGANFRMSNYQGYTGMGVFNQAATNPSSANIRNSLTTNWAVENLLTYDRVFAQKHRLNMVALYSAEQTTFASSNISRKNITADYFQSYNLGQSSTGSPDDIAINPSYQNYEQSGLLSYMGRAMYSYDDRYMLSATIRVDGSSRLANGHKWHSYPAISAGWNIAKESFMKDVTMINTLKLRVGYGQTSNQAVAPYSTLGTLSTRPYNFGTSYSTGYYVTSAPNDQLGWEYSITENIGIDFSILKNRLSGTIEAYITDTKDLLLSVNMPPTSGVGSFTGNVGATENKGWEFSLNGTILENLNGWTWDAGINLYGNKNKIVSLASGQQEDKSNWLFVGHSLNVIYDFKRLGLWNSDDPDYQYLSTLEPGGNEGMIKVLYTGERDENGKPTRAIGADDRQILECDPKLMGGFNTRVAYKGFDLSIVGTFQSGGILNSTLYGAAGYLNLEDGRRGQINIDYWTPDNKDARFPKPGGIVESNNPKYQSTSGYFDASYLKIRTITLGYDFNKKLTQKAGFSKIRVYGTVQNPFVLFSPYNNLSGLDPETNSYADDSANSAVAYGSGLKRLLTVGYNTPSSRNYLIGLNITF